MRLPPGTSETAIEEWQRVAIEELVGRLRLPPRESGNRVILVDGRSAGGKTTLADRLHAVIPKSAIVHTDDIA